MAQMATSSTDAVDAVLEAPQRARGERPGKAGGARGQRDPYALYAGCRDFVDSSDARHRRAGIRAREVFMAQPILLERRGAHKDLWRCPRAVRSAAAVRVGVEINQSVSRRSRRFRTNAAIPHRFEYGRLPARGQLFVLRDYVDHGQQSSETICLLLASVRNQSASGRPRVNYLRRLAASTRRRVLGVLARGVLAVIAEK